MRNVSSIFRRPAAWAAALTATTLAACQPATPAVEGWRTLEPAELRGLVAERQADDPTHSRSVTSISSDFNGDGKRDRVAFLVNESGTQFAPYIFDGAGAPPAELARGDARARLWRYTLLAIPAGRIYSRCQEYASSERDCAAEKASTTPAIAFQEVGRRGSVFVWDGASYVEWPIPG